MADLMPGVGDARLAQELETLVTEECWQVDQVLKQSPDEVTQRVHLIKADGSVQGPFIRKLINQESGKGSAYKLLYDALMAGQRIEHAPVIREYHTDGQNLTVIMEDVVGETLAECVDRVGPGYTLVQSLFPSICDAVSELHEKLAQPIIHRDLKPSNIIISTRGPVIIDFGIAREYVDGARMDTARLGTRSFAPPEQFGFGQTSVRSDVFALGVILYYCLTGMVPDTYIAEQDLADKGLPGWLQELILRATALDPDDRYASVRELKQAYLAAGGLSEPQEAQPERFRIAGKVWNVFLILVSILFYVSCFVTFMEARGTDPIFSHSYDTLCYLVAFPLFFISLAWFLYDKRRLARKHARLARYRFKHWLAFFLLSAIIILSFLFLIYFLQIR